MKSNINLSLELGNKIFSYEEIYENVLIKNIGILGEYLVIKQNNFFVLQGDNLILFSNKKVKLIVQIQNSENEYEIFSSIQIDEIIKDLKNPYIKFKDNKINYRLNYQNIFLYIENDSIKIYEEEKKYKSFIQNCITLKEKFTPKELTPNFYIYFKYNNKIDENKIFDYIESEERNNLNEYFYKLLIINSLHFFKFSGPTSIGKSTSLLKFSKTILNCIYLNLKVLKKLKNEPIESFNIIISECINLVFQNKEFLKNNFIELLKKCQDKNAWEIIEEIFNFHKINNLPLILIFDQFKLENIDIPIFEGIKNNIQNTKIKIIISSSINHKDIQSEIIKTLKKFKGNPEYNVENQNYYFYFKNLYNIEETNDNYYDLFKLFGFLPKYKYLFRESKSEEILNKEIKNINEHISKKILEFYSDNFTKSNIANYLLYLSSIIEEKIDYNNGTLDFIPLKYFILELHEEYFQIKYVFLYLKNILRKTISFLDSENFFENQKIKQNDIFYGKIKWAYFEYYAKLAIENQILKLNVDCNEKLTFKSIINMDYIINDDLNQIIKKLFLKKTNNNNINLINEINYEEDMDTNNNYNKCNKDEYIIPINLNLKTIDDYKKDNLSLLQNKKKKMELISGYENNNLILEQEKGKGECIDIGALFKDKKKIFLGFQIKFYSKDSHGEAILKIKKNLIKKDYYNKILLGSKQLLGIDIEEWHYVVIAYYNKNDKIDGPFCYSLISHCKKFGIEYIFFNPEEKKFYNKNEKEIKQFITNDYSNLDKNLNFMFPEIIINEPMKDLKNKLFLQKKTIFQNEKKINEEYKKIYNLFIKNISNEQNKFLKKHEIMGKYLKNLEKIIGEIKDIVLISSYDFYEDESIPFPAEKYLFLFNKKNSINFIAFLNKKKKYCLIDIENKLKLNILDGFSLINVEQKTFYVFKFNYSTNN